MTSTPYAESRASRGNGVMLRCKNVLSGLIKIPIDKLRFVQTPASLTPFTDGPIHAFFTPNALFDTTPNAGPAPPRRLVTAKIKSSDRGRTLLSSIAGVGGGNMFAALEELQIDLPDACHSCGFDLDGRPSPVMNWNNSIPSLRMLTSIRCMIRGASTVTTLTIKSVDTASAVYLGSVVGL